MTNITEDLVKLLGEHRFSVALHGCTCRRWTFSVAGNPSTLEVLAQHEDHVAEVIAAAGWLRGELDYRVWIERDPHQCGGLDLEEASGSGYWFPIKNLNVAKHRGKHPEARIEKRFTGVTDWEVA